MENSSTVDDQTADNWREMPLTGVRSADFGVKYAHNWCKSTDGCYATLYFVYFEQKFAKNDIKCFSIEDADVERSS